MSKLFLKKTLVFIWAFLFSFLLVSYMSSVQQRKRKHHWQSSEVDENLVDSGQSFDLKTHLRTAEVNWIRSHDRRQAVLNTNQIPDGEGNANARIIWDFFPPSFDCPYTKERIGRVGDGGKWICGFGLLVTKVKCTVLSFGVRDDTSFEEEILRRTQNCTVHMFDPTVTAQPSIVERYPGRAVFHPFGIGAEDGGKFKTLKSIMAELDLKSVDVLKMDVEGAEWEGMRRTLEDFPEKLPFAQLQVEVHLDSFPNPADWFRTLDSFFENLENAGMRQFVQEPNLLYERFMYRELGFLNVKRHPFKLED